jgi:hypothetical protein
MANILTCLSVAADCSLGLGGKLEELFNDAITVASRDNAAIAASMASLFRTDLRLALPARLRPWRADDPPGPRFCGDLRTGQHARDLVLSALPVQLYDRRAGQRSIARLVDEEMRLPRAATCGE